MAQASLPSSEIIEFPSPEDWLSSKEWSRVKPSDSVAVQVGAHPPGSSTELLDSSVRIARGPLVAQDVLVINDDGDTRALLRSAFQDQGYTVDAAASAGEGLALLRQRRYRILLLDMLPEAQGHELLNTFQGDPALRPAAIIVLPSQNQEAAVRSALAAGADDYLTMPVGMHDLMRRVRLWLRGVEAAIPGSRANRSGLQVHTLGRFYVEYRGEVRLYEGGKARKACALFKFLLTHHGRFVAASTVQELLWPGVPESIAVVDLRSMLYQLRKLLKGASQSAWPLEHTGTTLRLCLSPDDWWDADEFSAWLVEAAKLRRAGAIDQAMAAYKAAIALYKGDYLEDALLEDWATATRYQLSEEWRRALEALAALHGERGDRVEQGRLLRLVLRADPYREQSYRALMTLLALDGRGAEALILYHQLRTLLRVELGTGPDPQTQALASRITQPM